MNRANKDTSSRQREKHILLCDKFWRQDYKALAEHYRNPYIPILREHSKHYISELQKLVSENAQVSLGGSLSSGLPIRGKNDIDLRIFIDCLPEDEDALARTSSQVEKLIPFKERKTRPPQLPFFYYHCKYDTLDLIGEEVEIGLSILPECGDSSIGPRSRQVPEELRERYLVAKGLAHNSNLYGILKQHWVDMIIWLAKRDFFTTDDANQKESILQEAQSHFPPFFPKEKFEFIPKKEDNND